MAAATTTPAASSFPTDASAVKYRRTNSLAFAKSDCHNCSSLNRHCDRQRPRCTTCQDAGILCQGYSMKLTWHSNHSMVDKPPKVRSTTSQAVGSFTRPVTSYQAKRKEPVGRLEQTGDDGRKYSSSKSAQRFKFVPPRPNKRRKKTMESVSGSGDLKEAGLSYHDVTTRIQSTGGMPLEQLPDLSTPAAQPIPTARDFVNDDTDALLSSLPIDLDSPGLIAPSLSGKSPSGPFEWPQLDVDWIPPPPQHPSENLLDYESLEQCLEIQQQRFRAPSSVYSLEMNIGRSGSLWDDVVDDSSSTSRRSSTSSDLLPQSQLTLVPPVCYPTLTDKFYGLLDMYDQEFCKYPITSDFTVNPYRYRQETTRGSQHLLHAIVALSCHFRQRSAIQLLPSADAIDHKNTAVVLYQGALSRNDIHLHGLSMLDTSMALWQMEATMSALNIWKTHLLDAYQLLELCGGTRRWSSGMKANIQVSMFLWWDTMVSLLSREECVFPYSYFEAVLKAEGRQPWTFYELNGCPRELLVPMMQLSNLAARDAKKGGRPSKTISRLVAEIELSVRRYEYQGGAVTDLMFEGLEIDEEAMHRERDQYHCCEAFRYGLLIYILRIFTYRRACADEDRQEQERVRSRLSFLGRITLEHVHACRTTFLIQKQTMLPVFLAGAEARDPAQRKFALEFCSRWYTRFGYQMFNTVSEVMEAVWTEQDLGHDDYWWGDELDSRRAKEGSFVQFCFG